MMDVASASVINENAQINFKGSTCQKSILMKRRISNAWVMVGVMIMITVMNHVQTQDKWSHILAPREKKKKKRRTSSLKASVCLWSDIFITLIKFMSLWFQIWFYTNDIFNNAGIPEPYIQYTTVGTGAIEVISGMLGVSRHFNTKMTLSYNGT